MDFSKPKIGEGTYSKVYANGDKAFKHFIKDDDYEYISLIAELSALMTLKGKNGILDIGDISLTGNIGFSMKLFSQTLTQRFPYTRRTMINDEWRTVFVKDDPIEINSVSVDINSVSVDINRDSTKYILFQLLMSLYHAHKAGIVHGDIKPLNVLIDNINIALIDWGIAKFPWVSFEQNNNEIQTMEYKSPENAYRFIGNSFIIDGKADIYSLAILYYYITNDSENFHKYCTITSKKAFIERNPDYINRDSSIDINRDSSVEHLLANMVAKHDRRYSAYECLMHGCFADFRTKIGINISNIDTTISVPSLRPQIDIKKCNESYYNNRSFVVNYITEIFTRLMRDKACIIVAVMLSDFMASTCIKIRKDGMQAIFLAAILLASEFIEPDPILVDNLVAISSKIYTRDHIIKTRNTILRRLDYNAYFLTPIVVVRAICDRVRTNSATNPTNKITYDKLISCKDQILNRFIADIARDDYYENTEAEIAIHAVRDITGVDIKNYGLI